MHILEWRWSDEPDLWRYDSHVHESRVLQLETFIKCNNPQRFADAKNRHPARVPGSQTNAYQIWRVRKI